MKRVFAVLLLALSCSTLINHPTNENVALACHTHREMCPTISEINQYVAAFQDCRNLQINKPLVIHWYDSTYYWVYYPGTEREFHAIGYTEFDGEDIYTTSKEVLTHELMHLYHGQVSHDMDVTHADPPGPWTKDDDDLISYINSQMQKGNMRPCTEK